MTNNLSNNDAKTLSYESSGVNINAGNELVAQIKPIVKKTHRSEVFSTLGGFSGLCKIPSNYRQPVLVSATDGVGTKLRLAIDNDKLDTIGIDLVAMCANDLVVCGAEPLQFLDYYATGKLNISRAKTIIAGIAEGCIQAGCALIGGETAEMPGMYPEKDFDLAGFCQGIVEQSKIIDGSKVKAGDSIIALPSSGLHSNGYSLVRKILATNNIDLSQDFENTSLLNAILEPTTIYVKPLLNLFDNCQVNAVSNITGGGLIENIPRVLPNNVVANIDLKSWQLPKLFKFLAQQGNIEQTEMFRVFNCGIGMVVIVAESVTKPALTLLKQQQAFVLGSITASKQSKPRVDFKK